MTRLDRFQVFQGAGAGTDNNGVSTSANPKSSALSKWEDNNSMFVIVESALEAFERAKKLENTAFVEVARIRYERALSSYKSMFNDN